MLNREDLIKKVKNYNKFFFPPVKKIEKNLQDEMKELDYL